MSVTTVGTNTTTISSSAPTLTYPAGVQANDVAIIIFWENGAFGQSFTGYTLSHSNNGQSVELDLFYRVLTGSEGSTITGGSTGTGGAGMIVLRGIDTTTPVLGVSTDQTGGSSGGTTLAFGSVSWAGASDAVSLLAATWQSTTATASWPSGWNQSPDGWAPVGTFEWGNVACDLTTQSAVTSLPAQNVALSPSQYQTCNQYALKVAATTPASSGISFTPRRMPLGV